MTSLFNCPLCKSKDVSELVAINLKRIFLICHECDLRFLRPDLRMSFHAEKNRYDQHQNSVEDKRYQAFLGPLLEAVEENMPPHARGLDFGSGPEPVASELLRRKGFRMDLYDPIYQSNRSLIGADYDFIICSEVMEHFFDPHKEFEFLRKLLKKDGVFIATTQLWRDQIEFEKWSYHRDPTHVSFYSETTLSWIQKTWGFDELRVKGDRLLILRLDANRLGGRMQNLLLHRAPCTRRSTN